MRLGVIDFSEIMQTLGHFFEPLYNVHMLIPISMLYCEMRDFNRIGGTLPCKW